MIRAAFLVTFLVIFAARSTCQDDGIGAFWSRELLSIGQCNHSTTCGKHATCSMLQSVTTGNCMCHERWSGSRCKACDNSYGLGCMRNCDHRTSCSGHGRCNGLDGTCICSAGRQGASCKACDGTYGTGCDKKCDHRTTCSGHGRCDGMLGDCICKRGWGGCKKSN